MPSRTTNPRPPLPRPEHLPATRWCAQNERCTPPRHSSRNALQDARFREPRDPRPRPLPPLRSAAAGEPRPGHGGHESSERRDLPYLRACLPRTDHADSARSVSCPAARNGTAAPRSPSPSNILVLQESFRIRRGSAPSSTGRRCESTVPKKPSRIASNTGTRLAWTPLARRSNSIWREERGTSTRCSKPPRCAAFQR